MTSKFIIYQLLLRVFGNTNECCVPGGSLEMNGTGKFGSVSEKVLEELKRMAVTHVWYTGVIEHVTKSSFEEFGIVRDNPAVIKGEAGSPYAIKDYYDVNPYLADSVPNRMEEFHALVERTHSAGLKVIIDFIPNHLARGYNSDSTPDGVRGFGQGDNPDWAFSPQNNYYYLPGQALDLSRIKGSQDAAFGVQAFGEQAGGVQTGEVHACGEQAGSGQYQEFPARATGNDCFLSAPGNDDWYETVKLNYGVDYMGGGAKYFEPRPKTWDMMLDVLLFWAAKGVDGFRCDMAEMVPVEFWHWAIGEVKKQYPQVIFVAEVYNPAQYESYIKTGGFDFLYDKVGLYDNLKVITQRFAGKAPWFSPASSITGNWRALGELQKSMLNFLENHDEQRVASDFNIGNPFLAIPELAVSLLLNTAPFMVYFGQELGERGMLSEGFSGVDGRTSIFDYCSAPSVVQWLRGSVDRKSAELKEVYTALLNASMQEPALREGFTYDLEYANMAAPGFNPNDCFVFARVSKKAQDELVIVVADFSQSSQILPVKLPKHFFEYSNIVPGEYRVSDLFGNYLSGRNTINFVTELEPDSEVEIPMNQYGIAVMKFKLCK